MDTYLPLEQCMINIRGVATLRCSCMATNKPSVVVVDDDPLEGDLFVRALRKCGCENAVKVFTNAAEAKRYLGGEGEFSDRAQFPVPSLVILDHRMPGDSGWDVLEWMRQERALRTVPAIVFSGSGAPADEAKANELGAVYQVKPQNSEEYEGVIRRMAEFWLRAGSA